MQVEQAHMPFELTVLETSQWMQRPHQHNFFELVFIEEGEGLQCINHRQFPYQRESIFLLPPLDCHSFEVTTPTRFVFLRFTNQVFAQRHGGDLDFKDWFQKLSYVLINYNKMPGDVVGSARDKQHLLHCLQLIRDEHAHSDSFSPTLIQTALVTILNLLTRHIEATLLRAPTGADAHSRRFLHVLNHIQHFLFDNAQLRVAALAAQAGTSATYFSEYFRSHAGESLQTYITKSRLKVAEARLLNSDNSAKEIAYELGFTDTSHLSRTFKKYYGCTIQEFRKRSTFSLLSGKSCVTNT
ncbi:helix-turn-helix domain-containing protein [Hymenobacter terrenus]|uniref:helix-turn-helix domain-containing protein n=1 Tax=Hymenobacter terrenus TaxID=1629124 RepID=UPI0006191DA6|nr:AraC family transcriptional regulator [Hymenobacter terrenus]